MTATKSWSDNHLQFARFRVLMLLLFTIPLGCDSDPGDDDDDATLDPDSRGSAGSVHQIWYKRRADQIRWHKSYSTLFTPQTFTFMQTRLTCVWVESNLWFTGQHVVVMLAYFLTDYNCKSEWIDAWGNLMHVQMIHLMEEWIDHEIKCTTDSSQSEQVRKV